MNQKQVKEMNPQFDNILVEQTFTKIQRAIILPGKSGEEDSFEVEHRVKKIGPKMPDFVDLKEGTEVIIRSYTEPYAAQEIYRDDNKVIVHIIVPVSSIVATL